jgi:hypothetical protein
MKPRTETGTEGSQRLRCPQCGASLMREGELVWCSRPGSPARSGCDYGVWQTRTIEDYEADMRQKAAGLRGKRLIKRICPTCWGAGWMVNSGQRVTCSACNGAGQIEEEIEVR